MKRFIIGIVIGVVLTATATAAAAYGFKPMNRDVECRTTKDSVVCGLRGSYSGDGSYTVYISGCSAAVWKSSPVTEKLVTVFDHYQPDCR